VARFRSTFIRTCGLAFLSLALFSIAGGHWAVLQTVAWAQMLRDYSENATVAEALEKTFGGDAPCAMCKKITEARQKEEKAPATLKVEKKAEVFLATGRDILPVPSDRRFSYHFPGDTLSAARPNAPSDPVPIRAA
jgi:hypothetical protein